MLKKCSDPRPSRRAFLGLLGAVPAACTFPPAQRPRYCLGEARDGCREVLWSYNSLQYCRADVLVPDDVPALVRMLGEVVAQGRKLTIRGGGASLDSQALNGDAVIRLDRCAFKGIAYHGLDSEHPTFTVGAGATWGEVLADLQLHDLVPYAAPSGSYIRVGGGFAANSFSRMSARWGREERYIRAFTIVTLDGRELHCTADSPRGSVERALWDTAPGALGYLGVVINVTYEARRMCRCAQVRTDYAVTELPSDDDPGYDAALTSFFDTLSMESENVGSLPVEGEPDKVHPQYDGVYGTVWWTRGLTPRLRTLRARVRYDNTPPENPNRGLLNRRESFLRIYGEYAMTQPGGESSVQNINFADVQVHPSSWDPVDDFAFFQDADLRAKLAVEPFWRMTSVEQAYCIPKNGQREFLRLIDDTVRLYDHFPTLVDLLWAPKDSRETPLPLSATGAGEGMVFTLAYLDRNGERWSCTRQVYRVLAAHCARLGGKVYLAKTVEVDLNDLRTMWGPGLQQLARLKRQLDPHGVLSNSFWRDKLARAL